MSRQLDQIASDAAARNLSFSQALESLADLELESRNQNAIERRFRLSRLQARHSIDSFNFKHHKSRMEIKARVARLLDLEFIDQGTSVIVIGNPGVGKTLLAKIIGWRACQANKRVLFSTAADMLNHLNASQIDHSLIRKLKLYTEPEDVPSVVEGRQRRVIHLTLLPPSRFGFGPGDRGWWRGPRDRDGRRSCGNAFL